MKSSVGTHIGAGFEKWARKACYPRNTVEQGLWRDRFSDHDMGTPIASLGDHPQLRVSRQDYYRNKSQWPGCLAANPSDQLGTRHVRQFSFYETDVRRGLGHNLLCFGSVVCEQKRVYAEAAKHLSDEPTREVVTIG